MINPTDTSASRPTFKWMLKPDAAQAPYFGEPWSKMAIGRVKTANEEKWVGFIGGGYSSSGGTAGREFFMVDLKSGGILWSYTAADNNKMQPIPASPAVVDSDNDGFIDRAYVGDMSGNVWKFKFCDATDENCDSSKWSGSMFFENTGNQPIYVIPAVTKASGYLWILWGTGDRESPMGSSDGSNVFYAVKDPGTDPTLKKNNLQDITQSAYGGSLPGWYMELAGNGKEKVLSDPTVFGGVIFFTTYSPDSTGADPCVQSGTARLYALALIPVSINGVTYNPGMGIFTVPPADANSYRGEGRSIGLGGGIASAPVFSQKPSGGPTDLYITLSGGGGQGTTVLSGGQMGSNTLNNFLQTTAPSPKTLHWRDRRIKMDQ